MSATQTRTHVTVKPVALTPWAHTHVFVIVLTKEMALNAVSSIHIYINEKA